MDLVIFSSLEYQIDLIMGIPKVRHPAPGTSTAAPQHCGTNYHKISISGFILCVCLCVSVCGCNVFTSTVSMYFKRKGVERYTIGARDAFLDLGFA